VTTVDPRPAASVVLVRAAPPAAVEPLEVYLIRRRTDMRFLGGYYAFPGGKVDPADGAAPVLARCHGVAVEEAEAIFPGAAGLPGLAWWVTAARELCEESGVLAACDGTGAPVDAAIPAVAAAIEDCQRALIDGAAPFAELLARQGWYCDLGAFRYLSHFITPTSSPIRYTARFFLSPVPPGQSPRLATEETSEGFWLPPGEGYRRFLAGEMAMAEPAEYALGYLAQFESLAELWAAHEDRRLKFHGVVDRIDAFYSGRFDWATGRWTA
jgi:8-oxo-dGTP pyrophosphatase MutT (NUDIX family)